MKNKKKKGITGLCVYKCVCVHAKYVECVREKSPYSDHVNALMIGERFERHTVAVVYGVLN